MRDELLRGDLRPLYLGWLAGVTAGEVDDNTVEPEVPPGMSHLRTLAADFDHHWNAANQHAERGTASGYDEVKRAIIDIADAYTLVSDRHG